MTNDTTGHKPVVLITGASSGLGAGMARLFAERGYDLALSARRLDRLEALRGDIVSAHPQCHVRVAALDVTDHAAVQTEFEAARHTLGRLDRVIVNAGIGTGAPVGKGATAQNINVAQTNFTAALAQAEAALSVFRAQNSGHLVFISSMSAMRGMRGAMTVYAASKAAVAALAEGLRAEMMRKTPIKVSVIFPGYIRTEINAHIPPAQTPFIVDSDKGCRLLVRAIEAERPRAYVPWWPWAPLGWVLRKLPLTLVSKLF